METKGGDHQLAAIGARNALRNDHMRGRVVAAEREPETEQADREGQEIFAQDQQCQKRAKDDHLGDEHPLAAEIVGQAAEQDGAKQNAREARGADSALFGGGYVKIAHDQRQRHRS
ncbi:MAG TPA: hypothetical protein VNV39_11720 [Stellaceae bacterium]|nr:hypothetical protein [Stellaceae bacterium]